MRPSSTSGPAAVKVRRLVVLGSAVFLWRPVEALSFSHMLWITVCDDFLGGSLDYLRFAHCSEGGGAYCQIGDYNSSDQTQDTLFSASVGENVTTWTGVRGDSEEGFETALIGPGATYGFGYSLDVDPTTLVILKEPGYDALCLDNVGWQRSNSTTADWSVEGSNLLGNSTLIYLNEPEYAEDPQENYPDSCWLGADDEFSSVCDEGQITTCSGGLYTDDTTQTESPCVRGWHFFNLYKDADYDYELKMEGCSGSGISTAGVSASFCPDPYCNTSGVVEEMLGGLNSSSGATIFPVKLDFNPVAIRLSASSEDGWCANAMSFNGFTLSGSYPYEMAANESRIVENIQYFGIESTSTTSDGTPLFIKAAWPTAMMTFVALTTVQLFVA